MTIDATGLALLRTEVRRLADIEEIKRLKARYFRYLDLHWWSELRALFTDDAAFEIGESTTAPRTADEFVAALRRHLDQAMSVHHGHMPEVEVLDAEHAYGIWAMYDLVEPAIGSGYPLLTGYGHYTEAYRKIDGHWRIAHLRLSRLKRSVDGAVVDGAEVDGRRAFSEPGSGR